MAVLEQFKAPKLMDLFTFQDSERIVSGNPCNPLAAAIVLRIVLFALKACSEQEGISIVNRTLHPVRQQDSEFFEGDRDLFAKILNREMNPPLEFPEENFRRKTS